MVYKAVFFDFDNTLIQGNVWDSISKRLNCVEEDARLYRAFLNGEIDFGSWNKSIIELYKSKGLTREVFYEAVRSIKPVSNAKNVIDSLKNRGFITGIISGSIKNAYDFFREEYDINVHFARFAVELFFSVDGSLVRNNCVSDRRKHVRMHARI